MLSASPPPRRSVLFIAFSSLEPMPTLYQASFVVTSMLTRSNLTRAEL